MAMTELTADRRQYTGKEINRKRRVEGKIPGVIYGKGLETRSIEFQRRPLEKFLDTARRGTVVVKMTVQDGSEGKETYAVLKETQTHPLTGRVTHVDFYEVALGRKFRVEVPLRIKGKAVGIEMGGVLDVVTRSLEVECTPDHVPEVLELDVTSLGIGDSLHLSDVRFPEGVVPTEKDLRMTLAAVHTPKAEAAPVAVEEVAAEGAEGASWRSPERRKRSRKRKRRSRKRKRRSRKRKQRRRSSTPRDSSSDWGIRGAGTAPRSTTRGSWRSTGSPNRWACGGARAPRPRWEPA